MYRLGVLGLAILLVACSPVQQPSSASPSSPPPATPTPSTTSQPEPPGTTSAPKGSTPGQLALTGEIAYVAGQDPQIFLLDLATGESRQLTELRPEHAELADAKPMRLVLSCGFGPADLSWSPDGSLLAFSYGSCEAVVYLVDLEGTLRRVGEGRSPDWSPDGRTLIFSPNSPFCAMADCGEPPAPGAWNLQMVDVTTGSDPRPLSLHEAARNGGQPAYSPDGKLIAYTGLLPDAAADPELFAATYVIGADGTDPRLIARGAWPSTWLPDGRLLLVDERTGDLRALDLATTDAVPLGGDASFVTASPDGTRLLLVNTDTGTGTSMTRMASLDGETLSETPGYPAAWAPDSSAAVLIDPGGLAIVDRDGAAVATYELPDAFNLFPPAGWRPGS
jgi:Tol biopolymer transport system component